MTARHACSPTASTASPSARSTSCCAIRATASGLRSPLASRTGCTRSAPISPTATSPATRTASSASSPTGSASRTRSGSTRTRSSLRRRDGRPDYPPAGRRARKPARSRGVRPVHARQGSVARRHRLRRLWQPLGHAGVSDKLFVLTPEGDMRVLLDEGDPVKVDALEQAFVRNNVSEDVLFATGQGVAPWMASVTFGDQISGRFTSDRSRAGASPISVLRLPACRWCTGTSVVELPLISPASRRRRTPTAPS